MKSKNLLLLNPLSFVVRLSSLLLILFTSLPSYAQSTCSRLLDLANEQYLEQQFDSALATLRPCQNITFLPTAEMEKLYTLLGHVYLGKAEHVSKEQHSDSARTYIEKARKQIEILFEKVPDYEPDQLADTKVYLKLVEEVRPKKEVPPEGDGGRGTKFWAIAGGSATAIIVVAAVVLSGRSTSPEPPMNLPAPPDYPGN